MHEDQLYDYSPEHQQNEDEDDQMSEEDHYEDMLYEVSNEDRWNVVSIKGQCNGNLYEDHHGWNLHEDLWNALPDETFEQFYRCFPISSLKRVCHMIHI